VTGRGSYLTSFSGIAKITCLILKLGVCRIYIPEIQGIGAKTQHITGFREGKLLEIFCPSDAIFIRVGVFIENSHIAQNNKN
ncbi:hypothetical protein ACJX0J_012290, partial [Zea mays]